MNKGYRHIGKPTPRKDAREIVTGTANYINDLAMKDMLYGKVLRSPHAHAIITNIDTSKAKSLNGVKAVLTYEEVPPWRGGTPGHVLVLDKKVRYVGDAVAIVAATSEQLAEEALQLIEVEYETLPAVFDVEEAMQPGAPQLYESFPGNVLPLGQPWFGKDSLKGLYIGDVEKGFAEADIITEGTYEYENIPHPLSAESPGAIVAWEGPDQLCIWTSSQSPSMDEVILGVLMRRKVKVRVIGTHCGGSFGSRAMHWQLILHAALLAQATKRPVKLCFSKEEHFAAFGLRLGSRIHAKVGIKKDGTVTAISGDWLVNTGYYSNVSQGQISVGCGEVQLMVRCPNWDLRPKLVVTNRTASGVVRGYGGLELKCAFIPILTEALQKAGLDPFEFFKKNYVKAGDSFQWRDGKWWECRGIDYSKAMEQGAEKFGWKEKWKGWLKPTDVNGTKRKGVGVGVHGNADVGEDVSECMIRLDPSGRAVIFSSLPEIGTGQRSNLCKMAAEVLNLPLEKVTMTPPDPILSPYEFGFAGSRGTYAIGSAVIAAAEDALKKLFELAAKVLESDHESLETEDGMIFSGKNPEKKINWKDVLGFDRTLSGYGRFEGDFTMPNFMMIFVEVEVDTEDGSVELLRVLSATDVGQIIDPPSLINQLHGALGSAGLDTALLEETVIDGRSGRMLNPNMVDYKWRTFSELPDFETVNLETPFPSHRFHAIGVGEISPAPGPSAVLMAVSNAIGIRMHSYPLTPDKILQALGKIKGGTLA